MGRQPVLDSANRRKGPVGTGRSRKRARKIQLRSAKDAHAQLAALQRGKSGKGKKRRRKQASAVTTGEPRDGDDGEEGDAASASGSGDEGVRKNMNKKRKVAAGPAAGSGKSTGFGKALKTEAVAAAPFERCFWAGAAPEPGEPSDELKLRRKAIGIKVRGSPTPGPVEALSDAGLPECLRPLLRGKRQGGIGIEKPTPIQAQVWPAALSGQDVIGIAPTGSGKTLAYLVPVVPHILAQKAALPVAAGSAGKGPGVVCLVLAPTRELAKQVCDSCGGGSSGGWLKRLYGLRAAAVYGGVGKELQLDNIVTLGTPQVLVATPGRLLDLVSLGVVSLSTVTYLVLDEGDRMLALGFEPQLAAILRSVRPNRQLLLFSATFPGKLREAAEQWMAPERVVIRVSTLELKGSGAAGAAAEGEASEEEPAAAPEAPEAPGAEASGAASGSGRSSLAASATVHQSVDVCPEFKRPQRLIRFLRRLRRRERNEGRRQRSAVLIFCSQIKTLRSVEKLLNKHGERSAALHSGLPQGRREQALADLKNGTVDTLVATDVASRGLHIARLKYVVNYEFPSTVEVYCHRIGRVGRGGVEGWAYSFVDQSQAPLASGLAALLRSCSQPVSPGLEALAAGKEAPPDHDSESSGEEAAGGGAAAAADGDAQALRPGASVRLVGLQAAADLNGRTARVRRALPAAGRWEVQLRSGELKSVKADNLEAAAAPAAAGAAAAAPKAAEQAAAGEAADEESEGSEEEPAASEASADEGSEDGESEAGSGAEEPPAAASRPALARPPKAAKRKRPPKKLRKKAAKAGTTAAGRGPRAGAR